MVKKSLLATLAILILIQPFNTTYAVGPVVRIVAGSTAEKILKGVAEKAGMKFATKKQSDDFVNYMNSQASTNPAYNQFLRDFDESVKTLKPITESGWKKYVLDPALWLAGADVFWDVYQVFKGAKDNQENISTEEYFKYTTDMFSCTQFIINNQYRLKVTGPFGFNVTYPSFFTYPVSCQVTNTNISSNPNYHTISVNIFFSVTGPGSGYTGGYLFTENIFNGNNSGIILDNNTKTLINMIDLTPTLPNLPYDNYKWITPFIDDLPQEIEVNIPDETNPPLKENGDFIGDDDVWNEPIELINIPPQPEVPFEPEEEKPIGSSWWKWLIDLVLAPINLLVTLFQSLIDLIGGLVSAILDGLKALLIPSDDFFINMFSGFKSIFDTKLPVVPQLQQFFTTIKDTTVDSQKPKFEVTLPEEWGGQTYSIIDFSFYDDYRTWILNFIRFIAWFIFLKKLYQRIPRMIY